jgi:hypothetical protein
MTRQQLQRRLPAGASITDESVGHWTVWQIEAPDGQVWSDGAVTALRVEWRTGDAAHRDAALRDALARVNSGLEEVR